MKCPIIGLSSLKALAVSSAFRLLFEGEHRAQIRRGK